MSDKKPNADDFDWVERQRFLTFLFCLYARALALLVFLWCPLLRFFFSVIGAGSFFLLWRISSWVSWMKAAECWVRCRGERNTEGERGWISRHVCVGSSQSSPVPWDATTQPSQAQHRASKLYPRRLGPDTSLCVILIAQQFGLLIPCRILFAAIILSRSFVLIGLLS